MDYPGILQPQVHQYMFLSASVISVPDTTIECRQVSRTSIWCLEGSATHPGSVVPDLSTECPL